MISIFLHKDCEMLVPAMKYLRQYSDKGAIECLIETDLNILVKVLKPSEDAVRELKQAHDEIDKEINEA